jgi:hypothetical protein
MRSGSIGVVRASVGVGPWLVCSEGGIITALPNWLPILEMLVLKLSPTRVKERLTPSTVFIVASAEGNSTRPLALSPLLPPRVLKAAISLASLSLVVDGRAGDGEVAKNSMRSAASVSFVGA